MINYTISWRFAIVFLTIVFLVFVVGLIRGIRITDEVAKKNCLSNVSLPFGGGVSLNCDTWGFLEPAENPDVLFEKKHARQARPGYIFLARMTGIIFYPIQWVASGVMDKVEAYHPKSQEIMLLTFVPYFVAYAFLDAVFSSECGIAVLYFVDLCFCQ